MIVRKWTWEAKKMQAQRIAAFLIGFAGLISLLLCIVLTRTEHYADYARVSSVYFSMPPEDRDEFLDTLEEASSLLFFDMGEKDAFPQGLIPDSIPGRIRLKDSLLQFSSDRKNVLTYSSYLQEIQTQSKKMQMLAKRTGKQDYAVLKMQKESNAYAALADVVPVFDHNAGVHFFIDAPGYFALVFLVPMGLALCVYDHDRKWIQLIKTSPAGKRKIVKTKLGILLLYVLGFSSLSQAVYFLWACLALGCGDLSRSAQSVYINCVLPGSVGTLMFFASALRFLAACLVAGLALLMSLLLSEKVVSIPITLSISISGWLLQRITAVNEALHILKKMNLWIFLRPKELFCVSDYVNLFGKPFFAGYAAPFFCLVCLFLLTVMCDWRYACAGKIERHDSRLLIRQKPRSTTSLWRHEMHAFWIGRGGWRLFGIFLLILGVFSSFLRPEMSVYDRYLYRHIEEAKKQEDPAAYLEEAYNRNLEMKIPNPNERQALADAMAQYSTLRSKGLEKTDFKFETGYRFLLTDRTGIVFRTLLTLLMLLLMALLFQDSGYSSLLRTYPAYTKAYKRYSLCFCGLGSLLVTVPVQGLYLLITGTVFLLPDIHADVYTLSFMSGFTRVSILGFFLLLLLLRLLLAFGFELCCVRLIESRQGRT